jgi:hypothetical protein
MTIDSKPKIMRAGITMAGTTTIVITAIAERRSD